MKLLRLTRTIAERFFAHHGPQWAGHIAFCTLLALFPFLIVVVSAASFLGTGEIAGQLIYMAFDFLPGEMVDTLSPVIVEILSQRRGGLMTVGIIGTIWAASSGLEALRLAINDAYGVTNLQAAWRRRAEDLILVLVGIAATILAVFAVIAGPFLWDWLAPILKFQWIKAWMWALVRYAVAFSVLILGISVLYRWLPNLRQRWHHTLPGAVTAAVLWLVGGTLFSLYLSQLGNHTMTYGSLGGIVVTMMFFYMSGIFFVLGAEVNGTLGAARAAKTQERAAPNTP